MLSPASRAGARLIIRSWGFARKASLHPRLYAVARFAGWRAFNNSILGFRSQSLAPPQALRFRPLRRLKTSARFAAWERCALRGLGTLRASRAGNVARFAGWERCALRGLRTSSAPRGS